MTKRRYVLIGIPVACLLSIIVSLILSESKEEPRSAKQNPSPSRQLQNIPGAGTETVTQAVAGLTMPSYDEQGKEVVIMRGENTFLLNDNVYKMSPRKLKSGTIPRVRRERSLFSLPPGRER